jgi:hypothetical protein
VTTPLGFTTRQITNAYRVHEPMSGLGLLAMNVFATESNCWTPSASVFYPKQCEPTKTYLRCRKDGPCLDHGAVESD